MSLGTGDGGPITTFEGRRAPGSAILSAAKSRKQARFYVASDKRGIPQEECLEIQGLAYDGGVADEKGRAWAQDLSASRLGLPVDYWNGPATMRAVPAESVRQRPRSTVVSVNLSASPSRRIYATTRTARSAAGSIQGGEISVIDIDVVNLSKVELGALPVPADPGRRGAHLRLGGGKPLGFGSVHACSGRHRNRRWRCGSRKTC